MAKQFSVSAAIGLSDQISAPAKVVGDKLQRSLGGALTSVQQQAAGVSSALRGVTQKTESVGRATRRYQREAEGVRPIDRMLLELADARAEGLDELALQIERNIALAKIEARAKKGYITQERVVLETQIEDIKLSQRLKALKEGKAAAIAKAGAAAKKSGEDARWASKGWSRLGDGLRRLPGLAGRITGIGGLIGGVSAVGAAGGLVKLVDTQATSIDTLDKFATRVGVGIGALQEWQFAAQIAGINGDEFNDSLQELSQRIGEAKAGEGELLSFLQKVSPALWKQVKGAKGNGEALEIMVQAMRQIEDPAKRAAFANKIFGESGRKMALLANMSAGEIAKLREEKAKDGVATEEAAKIAADYADTKARLGSAIQGVGVSLASSLLPKLTPLLGRLTEWVRANRDIIATKLSNFVTGLGEALGRIDWVGIATGIGDFVRGLVGAAEWLGPEGLLVVGIGAAGIALTALLGPLGLVAGAILLLAANWDSVTKACANAVVAFTDYLGLTESAQTKGDKRSVALNAGTVDQFKRDLARDRIQQGRGSTADLAMSLWGVSLPTQAASAGANGRVQVEVDFRNVPAGARVNTDTDNPAQVPVKTNVGRRTLGTGAP